PEPMTVARLVHGDAVNPRLHAGLAAEAMNGAEHPHEDFLRQVQGFVAVAKQVDGELHDHALVLGHEFGAGEFVAGGAALDKRRFATVDVRPTRNPGLLHGEFHYSTARLK